MHNLHNPAESVQNGVHSISEQDRKLIERYQVCLVPVDQIHPSPENEEVYGPINEKTDSVLPMLMRSIERLGLEEPLILTIDNFILSGHRRFYALQQLGWDKVPARYACITRSNTEDYHRLLAQYNPQRVKSVASVLSERLLNCEDDYYGHSSWADYRNRKQNPKISALKVTGAKNAEDVGPRQQEFLKAAIKAINDARAYWPMSVRGIHYLLLNKPPLTQTTKKANERWRYKNDLASYNKLSGLLVSARYFGHVPWDAIDDSTRDSHTYSDHYEDLTEFVSSNVDQFLSPYRYSRSRQEGQPNHIEVLIEKNTLINTVSDICDKFQVTYTSLRGYGGPSVWHEMEERFLDHENEDAKFILIVVSDHDPEGLNLADDAVRSLRDNHNIEVRAIRPAVTREQIRKYRLPSNPAKETSSRFAEYVKRTGTRKCWECESLKPEVLRQALHDAILSALDVDQLNAVQEREAEEKNQIAAIKRKLGTRLQQIIEEEGF